MSYKLCPSSIQQNIDELEKANEIMDRALELVRKTRDTLGGTTLSGNSIDQLYSMHCILYKYQENFNNPLESTVEALKSLIDDAQKHYENGEIPKEWK